MQTPFSSTADRGGNDGDAKCSEPVFQLHERSDRAQTSAIDRRGRIVNRSGLELALNASSTARRSRTRSPADQHGSSKPGANVHSTACSLNISHVNRYLERDAPTKKNEEDEAIACGADWFRLAHAVVWQQRLTRHSSQRSRGRSCRTRRGAGEWGSFGCRRRFRG